MTHIKICGIKEEGHALALAEAGVDFMGLVFASSPRQVTTAQAKKLVNAVKKEKNSPAVVGVFANTPAATIRKIAETCNLDWIQLSGDEPWGFCRELNMPVIKVIRVSRNYRAAQACTDIEYGSKLLGKQRCITMLDSNTREKYGGTGKTFDWNLARPITERFPVIVAGGLTPDNVEEAIKMMKPWGVDISSGVETKGVKDLNKILKFIEKVRGVKADGD